MIPGTSKYYIINSTGAVTTPMIAILLISAIAIFLKRLLLTMVGIDRETPVLLYTKPASFFYLIVTQASSYAIKDEHHGHQHHSNSIPVHE